MIKGNFMYLWSIPYRTQMNIPIEIDFVYTWVDGTDINWWNEKQTFQKKPIDNARWPSITNSEKDELYYSVHLTHKNAPWIRKIYIVTQRPHVPKWLNKCDKSLQSKIIMVHHDEIFDVELQLPCYNSDLIESQLYKIPNLSEYFVYCNDDFFIGQPVEKCDFFQIVASDDKLPKVKQKIIPVYEFTMKCSYATLNILYKLSHEMYMGRLYQTVGVYKNIVSKNSPFFCIIHRPYSFIKSEAIKLNHVTLYNEKIKQMTRFRESNDIVYGLLLANFIANNLGYKRVSKEQKHLNLEKYQIDSQLQALQKKPHYFCISSGFNDERILNTLENFLL
jgi:hypothetical protein